MIRQTSIDAYNALRESDELGELQWSVYDCLFNDGPLTSNEVAEKLRLSGVATNKPSVTPRFAELQEMGVIRDVGERECTISEKLCVIWDVTNARAVNPRTPKPTRKQLEEQLKALQEAQRPLQQQIEKQQTEINRLNGVIAELRAELESLVPASRKKA